MTRAARLANAAALSLLMAACGGGSGSSGTAEAMAAADAPASGMQLIQSATVNAEGPSTTLTVRAHGRLAGDIGPIMQVLVDGVLVSTTEVRATAPTDYSMAVPPLQPGAKVDVVFTNNAVVDGVDRDLFVSQLIAGNTYLLPTDPGSTYDLGRDAAAFDGLDVRPGQGALYSSGALRMTWPAPNLTDRLTVRASASLADGTGPPMALRVNGVTVGSTEVRSDQPTDHVFAVPTLSPGSRIDVVHTNHATINGSARNLNVAYLMAGTTVLRPTDAGMSLDLGSGLAAFDNIETSPGQPTLAANGALRGKWPAPNLTDVLTVRASGSAAGGVAPIMQVLVDGIVLGSAAVTSTDPIDLRFPTLPMQPGRQVQAIFTNPGSADGQARSLSVAYAIAGNTFLLASNGKLQDRWPEPNLTSSLTVRASGRIAGNVGPIMQLRVNGVMVASTEVRATEPTDHTFAVPPLQPGAKVDLVFTNNALIDGVDRDLFVDYLVAGNTYILPNAPGTVYDIGRDAAAFDGLDLRPGQRALYSSGALRMTWPQPNITDTVTVRASGSIAGGVGPVIALRVNGVIVSSTEVRSATLADHSLATPTLDRGSKIELLYTNPGQAEGVERQLSVAYLMAGTTVLRANAAGVAYNQGNLQAAWPAPNLTDRLTMRAHGRLAGGVGPIMQVLVDGVLVSTTEVRATAPTDYSMAVPALQPGAKVDVVFTNNAIVDGVDRDLFVSQLIAGNTYLLPADPGSTYDVGLGAAAFDGLDVRPGQGALYSSGALRMTWPAPNLTQRLTVRASASLADGTGPLMALRVNGVIVGSTEVRADQPTDHVFAVPALAAGSSIDLIHTNHAIVNASPRNLHVHYLRADNTVLRPTDAGMRFDLGTGLAAFDNADTSPSQPTLAANGALRGKWPAPNLTDVLTVRASGSAAGGVAPVMQVLVDGIVLGSAAVASTDPIDLRFPTLPMQPGRQVQAVFTNPGTTADQTRSLSVAYAIAGNTFLLADSGRLQDRWPEPNLTSSITVRASGRIAGNVGPVMQLRVNGVTVASTEVRATEPTDHTFAAPPLQPGDKVDLLFTNNALIDGVDRDLFVDYLVAGNTYTLPNAPGTVYDVGRDAAAFDGQDVRPGQRVLYSSGALQITWPQPNITERITVRASGTLAGGIGPVMLVRVDGVAVSAVEVRSATPTDYSLAVPPLQPGSRIDVAFTNDAIVDGADRNLQVVYIQAGSTVVLPASAGVQYDLGAAAAAFDGLNTLPGQSTLALNGALRLRWPEANITDRLVVRASGSLAAGIGPQMQVRVDGVIVGTAELRSTSAVDLVFTVPRLVAGSRIDLVYLNNATLNGEDRNLFVQYLRIGDRTLVPTAPTVHRDYGAGEAAFDDLDTAPGDGVLYSNGALRFTVQPPPAADALLPAKYAASRFLQQATFGPTLAEIERLSSLPYGSWIAEQMALPAQPDFVRHVQSKYDLGDAYRPKGSNYTNAWPTHRFWATAATSPDQLRKRVAFALHQIFMVSQADSSLYDHTRAYASYLDILNQHAFGNYRALLEAVALSPAMGIYLSHIRNRKEDPLSGRLPDENFARELMQLFTIGLHELNDDGTPRVGADGQPIETYDNQDVMALAKVFTGFGWAFPDEQLTEWNFRWGHPDYRSAADLRIDLKAMKPYPGQHSPSEKRLFAGKPHAVLIPAHSTAEQSVRQALDALFMHPNVGPFIGRQLIQRLVTSHPSTGYVARVAAAFNNNGAGVRGDMAAVVRAVLLDPEARNPPPDAVGKLREPVLRVAHWMRSMAAESGSGQYQIGHELTSQAQRVLFAPSVFGYFRPGFVPPNTAFAANGITVPELQIVNESTTAHWLNLAYAMTASGLGWTGTAADVRSALTPLVQLAAAGDVDGLIERLNLLLMGGRMSPALRQSLLDAVADVRGTTATNHLNRARTALFLTLASPDYLVQR